MADQRAAQELDATPDATAPNHNTDAAMADMRGAAIWSFITIAGIVIYAQSALSIIWALSTFALLYLNGFIKSKTRNAVALPQWIRATTFAVSVLTTMTWVSFPVYLGISADFAVQTASALFLVGGAVLTANQTTKKTKRGNMALLVFCIALLVGPVINAINDPANLLAPYFLVIFAGIMFVLQLNHMRHLGQHVQKDLETNLMEVRRQESLSRLMFDQSSLVVYLLDEELRYVRVNDAFTKIYPDQLPIGRKMFELLHAPDLEAQVQRSLQGESLYASEVPVGRAGTHFWGFKTSPWRDLDGAILGVVCFCWDSTEAVLAKQEVARRAEILDIALSASCSVVLEANIQTNEVRWYGDPVPVMGRSPDPEEVYNFGPAIFPESEVALVKQGVRKAMAEGQYEFVHRIRMGADELGWVQNCVKAIPGPDGRTESLIYRITNITQVKQEEAELLEALSRAGQSLAAKRALLADLAQESGIDSDLLDGAGVPFVKARDEKLHGVGEIVSRFNNLLMEVEVRDDALGRAVGTLRKAREASESANVAKSQFLANMSHELRTPLNAIIGYSEMLYEDARDDGRESDARDLDRVLIAARSLLILINEILDLSKIEAGRMDVSVSDFDVYRLVSDAVETIRPQAEKNGNQLSVTVDEALETGRSDAFKLNQCLLNLLSNAAKFTTNGRIDVHANLVCGDARNWLKISVTDTGIGLSEDQAARLFQPFVQADASVTKQYGGTGLGLAISRRMMQLLGGDISLQSEQGEGSTFSLCLPLTFDVEQQNYEQDSIEIAGSAQGPAVLVIDDDKDVAELVQRSIGELGFRVLSAQTAEAGVRALKKELPVLILLDINLPDRSGWSLLQALSTADTTRDIPVIVHSVHDDMQRSLGLGACAHFVKPTEREVLAAAIARFARKRGMASEALRRASNPAQAIGY